MIGVMPYPIHSPALKTSCENSGVMPAFMKTGTITPDNIAQADTGDGSTMVATAQSRQDVTTKGIPVICMDDKKLPIKAVTTVPMLVALKIEMKVEAKNISTKVFPIPSKECPK